MEDKPFFFMIKSVEFIGLTPKPREGYNQKIKYESSLPFTNELKYFISNIRNWQMS